LPIIVLHKTYISKPPIHGPYFTQEGDHNHIRIYIGGTKTRAHASKHREEGDEAMDGTPHGYIGKSWRLEGGMSASATTGCKELINGNGAQPKQPAHMDTCESTNDHTCSSKWELFFI
jgi:hypothetical protein